MLYKAIHIQRLLATLTMSLSYCANRGKRNIAVRIAILLLVCTGVCARAHPVNNNATTTSPETNSTLTYESTTTSDPRDDLLRGYRTWISPCIVKMPGLVPIEVSSESGAITSGRWRRRSRNDQMSVMNSVVRIASGQMRLWRQTVTYYVSRRRSER